MGNILGIEELEMTRVRRNGRVVTYLTCRNKGYVAVDCRGQLMLHVAELAGPRAGEAYWRPVGAPDAAFVESSEYMVDVFVRQKT